MQLISKFSKGPRGSSLIFSVNAHGLFIWKIKTGITITNASQKVLDEYNCKPKKLWSEKGSEFYSRSMKSWLEKKSI